MLIKASEALEKTTNTRAGILEIYEDAIREILIDIQSEIDKSIDEGRYECLYNFHKEVKNSTDSDIDYEIVLSYIHSQIESLGYKRLGNTISWASEPVWFIKKGGNESE